MPPELPTDKPHPNEHKRGLYKWPHPVADHIMGTAAAPLPGWCRGLLKAISIPYGLAVKSRAAFYRNGIISPNALPCRVISVGNITVGGTGKTPLTIYLARLLQGLHKCVVILSRGYHGSSEKTGGVVNDGQSVLMDASAAGDEPLMMARQLAGVPVVVGGDRHASGLLALERFHPDVILLDDAYQHQRLRRDLNLILLDGHRPFGNGCLLPAGPLREPVSALNRADAVIFTRCRKHNDNALVATLKHVDRQPVFKSFHKPVIDGIIPNGRRLSWRNVETKATFLGFHFLSQSRVWGVSGIARNQEFRSTIETRCGSIIGFSAFPDHHPYSENDVSVIGRKALAGGARFILTTAKDAVRLPEHMRLPLDLVICGIEMAFEPNSDFDGYITQYLNQWGLGP